MRPLAFSTNAFKKNSLHEAVRAIAAAGYGGVEIMADIPHALPAALDQTARRELKGLLKNLHLPVSNINAFTLFADGDTYHPTWLEADESRRQKRVDHTLAAMHLAAELDCRTVSLQPGGPLIGLQMDRADAAQRFAQGLAGLLSSAQKLDITLAIEPEPGLLIQTAAEYVQFKQEFFAREPRIKMNCDIGHLFCVGDDPADVLRACADQIAHVHLEDIGANRVHQHLMPGQGAINFAAVAQALRDIDYSGWVTVELYPFVATAAQTAMAARQKLRAFFP